MKVEGAADYKYHDLETNSLADYVLCERLEMCMYIFVLEQNIDSAKQNEINHYWDQPVHLGWRGSLL